jgi:hypothetical protein
VTLVKGLFNSVVATWPATWGSLTVHLQSAAGGGWTPVADQRLSIVSGITTFGQLQPGSYRVVVEAADGSTIASDQVTVP